MELVAACPVVTVPQLTSLFYAENQTLQQRMDVLDVLCAAAFKLSAPLSSAPDKSLSVSVSAVAAASATSMDSSIFDPYAASRARVAARTRRWGKRKTALKESTLSKFGLLSNSL